jgi:hypothetical protein
MRSLLNDRISNQNGYRCDENNKRSVQYRSLQKALYIRRYKNHWLGRLSRKPLSERSESGLRPTDTLIFWRYLLHQGKR